MFDFDDRLNQPNTIAKYIEAKLREKVEDIDIEQFSGRGNEAYSVKVLSSLDRQGYDLIITVTSDALIIAHHTLIKTPTLYTNANNPLFLGFHTLESPGGNISGVSYYVPIEKQLQVFKKIQPQLQRLGFIFDKYNKSRKVELPESREACMRLGLHWEIEIIDNKTQLKEKVKDLIAKGVDAVIATSSGTIYKNIDLFIDVCDQSAIPVYSFNREGIADGAVAALSSDYYLIVDQRLLPMALSVVFEKVNPGNMPAAFLDESRLFINIEQLQKLNLSIPTSFLNTYEVVQ